MRNEFTPQSGIVKYLFLLIFTFYNPTRELKVEQIISLKLDIQSKQQFLQQNLSLRYYGLSI